MRVVVTGRIIWVVALIIMSACGRQAGDELGGSSPTQPTSLSIALVSVALALPAVNGGTNTTGTVTLNMPAPRYPTYTSIWLVSDNQAATVPSFVMVPAGSVTAEFRIGTTNVPSDADATITASFGDRSLRSTLTVRRNALSSFSYTITPTRAGGVDAVGRYTSDDTKYFHASCVANGIYASWSGQGNRWEFAMSGMPMRPGTFDVLGPNDQPPRLRIMSAPIFNGRAYICSDGKARVVVEEIEVRSNGDVERFVATIDQECASGSGRIHAEIVLARPPQPDGPVYPAQCSP